MLSAWQFLQKSSWSHEPALCFSLFFFSVERVNLENGMKILLTDTLFTLVFLIYCSGDFLFPVKILESSKIRIGTNGHCILISLKIKVNILTAYEIRKLKLY
jgi:hypothetical protein